MNPDLERWRGKIALVTGGSSGIGRAIALDLGRLGMRVAVAGRSLPRLEQTCAALRELGAEALALAGDQTSVATNSRFFAEVLARWGPIDVLVNSAGTRGGRSLLDASWDEIEAALQLNLQAPLLCMREAVAQMRGRPDTAIVNIASMTAHRITPGTPALYAATKHALRVLTDGLRAELAREAHPPKVALISPGLVDTPWHAQPDGLLAAQGAYPYLPLHDRDIVAAVRYILSTPPGTQVCDILLRPAAQPF
jgi:NAD(P)-dependent dehydrogenase (short-subunit alcohol dehydrogenase family)